MNRLHSLILLLTGFSLIGIGLVYCVDPNLLLSRYELGVSSASDDNMYRGAYGGLFVTLGASIGFGSFSAEFRRTATIIALLFMAGFAIGRVSSIAATGLPHDNIVSLLIVEIGSVAFFSWLLWYQRIVQVESVPAELKRGA